MGIFTDTDLIFNGHNIGAEYGIRVEEIRTALMQDTHWPSLRVPRRVGVVVGKPEHGGRRIEVDVRIFRDDRVDVTDAATELAGKLMTEAPAKLITRRDRDRWWMAVHDGAPDLEQFFARGFTVLEFFAPDGVMYSDAITQPLTAGANAVNVIGTLPAGAEPIITVTLAASTNTVVAAAGGSELKITRQTGTWPAGTVVVFDAETGQVSINGQSGMSHLTLGSRFFRLGPGASALTLTGGGGELTYKPRWA